MHRRLFAELKFRATVFRSTGLLKFRARVSVGACGGLIGSGIGASHGADRWEQVSP